MNNENVPDEVRSRHIQLKGLLPDLYDVVEGNMVPRDTKRIKEIETEVVQIESKFPSLGFANGL